MTWRRVPLLLPALAALSACSSGVPSARSGPASASASSSRAVSLPPAPASVAASGTAAPSASALPPQATSSSETSVRTGQFTEVFVTPLPPDAAQAAVVSDFRQATIMWNTSQENFTLVSPVAKWVTGAALKDLMTSLANESRSEEVPVGVDRVYLTRVTALTMSGATISMCDDGAGWVEENPRTGAVDPNFVHVPIDLLYAFVSWQMIRLDGHWALASVSVVNPPAAPAKACLP